ncbi:MAG: glycosyltransferase family 4 protein [Cyanobacteria bacterium SBLK]|nr:glycosyltransferase family 4 protein [Cyanobacteria bacterium SBLK]
MKILLIIHIPLKRNFGASRVQLELAEEWQKEGHIIEKFDVEDAFPQTKSSFLATLTQPHFSQKAIAYVREHGYKFDVIDAHQGNLPASKKMLGFSGLLVTRSVGLFPLYYQLNRASLTSVPIANLKDIKTKIINELLAWRDRKEVKYCFQSYQTCDLINLPNDYERQYLEEARRLGNKCQIFPFGLSHSRREKLAQIVSLRQNNASLEKIVFIGTWCSRKGAKDWREIIERVRQVFPDVSFLFLGTKVDRHKILQELQIEGDEAIEVVPSYETEMLPQLLQNATIGVFPSYLEGFGFAVLEQLAAGIPTVAYDIPGPRDMLQRVQTISLIVKVGDVEALSCKLVELLKLPLIDRDRLSRECLQVAESFSWSKIAKDTLNAYEEGLQKLR